MHDSEIFDHPAAEEHVEFEPEKRNCGRTGPTSSEGRSASSKNAIKHGACSRTLVLPGESEESWQLLLGRWCKTYQPAEDSLEYDFVLKTAQAEWHRIRTQRNYDVYLHILQGVSPFNWTPDQIKKHDLNLRYKTAAERAFQREYRLLEQHYKIHRPIVAQHPAREASPPLRIFMEDPTSPTGHTLLQECFGPKSGRMLAKHASTDSLQRGGPETELAKQAPADSLQRGSLQRGSLQRGSLQRDSPGNRPGHDPPATEKM
jgi:hypothetical protein